MYKPPTLTQYEDDLHELIVWMRIGFICNAKYTLMDSRSINQLSLFFASRLGKHVTIDDRKCLNLATHNYLGLSEDRSLAALKALRKYGVGSCGPRGFYGTAGMFS